MSVSDENLLPRFLLTLHNAYFQDGDINNFIGKTFIEGELHRSVNDGKYAYLPLLGILGIIETLGSVLTDKKGIRNNMEAFLELFMPGYLKHLTVFYNLRNTVVHDWDGGLKIALDTVQPASHHLEMRDEQFVVNIPQLYADFLGGFQAMKNMSEQDDNFAKAVTTRLKTKVANAERKV